MIHRSRTLPHSVQGLAAAALLALLGACGGGGDGDANLDLTARFNSSDERYAHLFQESLIRPVLGGFEGHAASCSLTSGTLPAGMTLNTDCRITGVPTEVGLFTPVVRVEAVGTSSSTTWEAGFTVLGPTVRHILPGTLTIGTPVSYGLIHGLFFWRPQAGDTLVYSTTGTLPPGLAIDATTGEISGTPTSAGTYAFQVRAQVTNAGRTVTVQGDAVSVQVVP